MSRSSFILVRGVRSALRLVARVAAVLGVIATASAQSLALEAAPYPGLHTGGRATCVAEGEDGRLWIAYSDRMQMIDGARVVDVTLDASPSGRAPIGVRCIAPMPGGGVVLGTNSSVWSVSAGETTARHLRDIPGGVRGLASLSNGAVFVRLARELHCRDPQGEFATLRAPDGTSDFAGMCSTGDALWCWGRSGIWRIAFEGNEPKWIHSSPVRDLERLVAAADGDSLMVLDGDGLFRLEPNGRARLVERLPQLNGVSVAATGPGGFWFAGPGEVWWWSRSGGAPRRVHLYQRGTEVSVDLSWISCDSQGLLWIGSNLDVLRAHKPIGIEHLVLDALDKDEVVTAVAEAPDGTAILATTSHRLLQERDGGWTSLDTPWPVGTSSARRGIVAMHASEQHGLLVGSPSYGIWRHSCGKWSQIPSEPVHALLRTIGVDPQGGLWVIGDQKILHRKSAEAEFERIAMPEGESRMGPAPASLLWLGTDTYLATFRDGVLRKRLGEDAFSLLGETWPTNGVMQLLPAASDSQFHAISGLGFWLVDRSTGDRTLLHPTVPSAAFRSAATATGGRVGLASAAHLGLYDPAASRVRLLSPREGAHPLGYSWRSGIARANGELLFGARRGFTRIRPEAFDHLWSEPRLTGVFVEAAGRGVVVDKVGAHWDIPVGTSSLQVQPRVVDRLRDVPSRFEVAARDASGREVVRSESGVLADLEPGTYSIRASLVGEWPETAEFELGRLTVPERPFRLTWSFGFAVMAAVMLAAAAWYSRRGAVRALPRRITIDRLLSMAHRPPEETLDVAFLSVAAGEECARRSGAHHVSVFLSAPGEASRVRLAEFGAQANEAADLAKATVASGRSFRDGVFVQQSGDHSDVLLCLRGSGLLTFEVFLHRVPTASDDVLEQCAEAVAPVHAALKKQAWIERLEADFAHQSARLAAGMHDLRGSLTALRVSAFSLREGEVSANAQQLANAAEYVLSRVERMLDGLENASGVQLQPGDPAEIACRTIELLRPRAQAKDIWLRRDLPTSVDGVQVDASWYARVVENVVGNAIKFSGGGTVVHVHAEVSAREFVLHVDDQGPGFRDWEREAVFLPGVTGSAYPTGGEAQSGLGLWIGRQAVRAMGGRLWVASKPGKGSRVSLSLPRSSGADRSP